MPNIVEFILQLQDGMSNPLADVTQNTKGARYSTDQLSEANKRLREVTGKSSGSISDLKTRLAQLKEMKSLLPASATKHMKEVNKEIDHLQKSLNKLEGTKVNASSIFSNLKASIPSFINPLTIAGAGIVGAINQGMKNSKEKLEFENLLGKDAGDSLFTNLKKMKGTLGPGVFDIGKDLKLSGVEVAKITPLLNQLGDVANGDATKLSTLGAAFGELTKEGKLTEAILGQMKSGGFDPLLSITQKTGESVTHLTQRFKDGKVSAKEIQSALDSATKAGGQFYGNLERINNSPTGKWNTIIAKAEEFTSKIGDRLLPIVLPALDLLADGFDFVADGIITVLDWLKPLYKWGKDNADMLSVFAAAVGGVVVAIKAISMAKAAWAAVTKIFTVEFWKLNFAMLANPIGLIIVAIAALVAGVMVAWNNFEGFRKVIYGVWETFKSVFTSIGNLFKQIFSPIGEAIAAIKEGRWGDAAVAAGKMIYNISPIGLVENVMGFAKDGGFSDINNAYERGAAKGSESWELSQKEKKDANTASIEAVTGQPETEAQRAARERKAAEIEAQLRADKANEKINAVSGGGVKNITVTVGKMFDNITFVIQNGTKQLASEIERVAEEAVVRAIASASAR